ncbi:Root_cap domain-containing protein [Cephalotus follicularis]|uniref:Root_cap domain-containing protein n=1 Tax=Cephalotus follicularis TaxID=3775 RepID=A0A1Q3BF18_CEPFO|nr:Root_cap domain-containing protein [Cephalotus follicularis]
MDKRKQCFLVALILVFISREPNFVQGINNTKKANLDAASTHYNLLTPLPTGQERAFCLARGACHYKTLVCPVQCHQRKPKYNRKQKGCFVDCSSKCEVTCKFRKSNCNGYGSLCYDPRFVGGDGVMFYFHGEKGGNFAIVSDDSFQINARFIGTRPKGRKRDFTWVQAFSVMFDTHTLVIAAKKVSHWHDNIDAMIVKWDGEAVSIPTDGEAEWRTNGEERDVVVERTDDLNSLRVTVAGLVKMDITVRSIGKEENRVHNYQIPDDDSFAHLETQFRFYNLTDLVEGILGKTYRPNYVSPVKRGVPMPMMGGEDKYKTPSLYSPLCSVCRFQRQSGAAAI